MSDNTQTIDVPEIETPSEENLESSAPSAPSATTSADSETSADAAASDGSSSAGSSAAVSSAAVSSSAGFGGSEERSLSQLEEEGEVAADYIEEFLDICDLDGDIDIDARNGRAYVSVTASGDSNLRVLSRSETVQALQELTRLAVQAKTGAFSRLILDIGGSREARESELARLVERAAERIEGGATEAALPPMSSYERKLVHDLVAERGYVSESRGEGRERHTVVSRA